MVSVVWDAPNVLLLQMCSLFCAVKLGKAISGKKTSNCLGRLCYVEAVTVVAVF